MGSYAPLGIDATDRSFIRWAALDADGVDPNVYPFSLPVVAALRDQGRLDLDAQVTFLAGDNATGKSTLIEAIAVAAGFNPEGGSRNFRFATRPSESTLGQHLRLAWSANKPRTGFFLRAESFYTVATEIEHLEQIDPGLLRSYGGHSLHERSHGESFLDLAVHRFGPRGLYLLDEPEAALSVKGCLALLRRMHELVAADSQFIVATHSPILLAFPHARIHQIDDTGELRHVPYQDVDAVRLTRAFLEAPDRFFRHLLTDD